MQLEAEKNRLRLVCSKSLGKPQRLFGNQEISPSFCLDGPLLLVEGCSFDVDETALGAISKLVNDASDAVLRGLRFAAIDTLGASSPFFPDRLSAGFRTGAREGMISRASSRTSTAPSCLLSFSTMS